jgi:uncharacterized protein (DUF1684 family)
MKMIKGIAFVIVSVLLSGLVTPALAAQLNDGRDDPLSKWKKSVINHRRDKNREFKSSPTSPMAAVQRHTFKNTHKKPIFVIYDANDSKNPVKLSDNETSGVQAVIKRQKDKWIWQRKVEYVNCVTGNNKPVPEGAALPAGALLRAYRWTVKVYHYKEGLVLLVFDLEYPQYKQFTRLLYYPPNRKYAVQAKLEKFPKPKTITMMTSQNLKKTYYRYAYIHFKLDGKALKLTAFKSSLTGTYSDQLFIPFADTTSGEETYGSGRFLEVPEPGSTSFEFDFNFSFNPLCNYSESYNCPLPPKENVLDVPIRAGELTYPHHK